MPCRHEQNSHEDPDLQPDFVSKGVGDHGPSPTQRYKIQRLLHGLETITRLHDLPIAGRRLVGAGDDRQIAARFAIDLIEGQACRHQRICAHRRPLFARKPFAGRKTISL